MTRLAAITASLMLTASAALNSGVATRRARASTVHTVTTTADSGPGSLRDAVGSSVDGDTVMFNLALPATISLTSGEIDIVSSITITGPGANQLTVSGSHLSRVFSVALSATVSISGLTIANGTDIIDQLGGGGISNSHQLSVTNCAFSGNQAAGGGAGIVNYGTGLSATNCTFDSNSTSGAGGGIANGSAAVSLSVNNCVFSNNTALIGAGIANSQSTLTAAVNCTFSNNKALQFGGAIVGDALGGIVGGIALVNCTMSANSGGGIFIVGGLIHVENCIIADSTGKPDCSSSVPLALNSHNLIKDGSCSPMLSGDPMLGPLQNNGGPTSTMALLAGSPAIDAGDDSVLSAPLSLTTDQRGPGFPRKSSVHVDIGAFEIQVPVGPSFDTCLNDNSTGNLMQWNSTTGQYQFTRCSDGFTLSGTGTLTMLNGIRMLTDRKPDRRISAGFSTSQLTGSATIYLNIGQGIWQLFRINDTNPSAVCKC